jgi:hypothetical protein
MYSFIFIFFIILKICVWIQRPVVDIVIMVNNSLIFVGRFMIVRLFRDEVISVMLSKNVFKYLFLIKLVGRMA